MGAFSTGAVYNRPMQSVGDSGGSWAECAPRFHQAIEQEFVSVKPRAVGLFFGGIDMIGIGTRNLTGQHLFIAGKAGALAVCI